MATRTPLVLKKHVGAIHVKGVLALTERKVSNVLLLNAYDELDDPTVKRHSISIQDLSAALGLNSNNVEYLKDVLLSLVKRGVEWNVLDQTGIENWGASTLLASARIPSGSGVCWYQYSDDLRELLHNPRIYAPINLAVQTLFKSQYALALYENCYRFRDVGSTGTLSIETWRGLLGVAKGQYPSYRKLRERVLSKAVKEVNEIGHIHIAMNPKRSGRKVTGLQFDVRMGRLPDALVDAAEARATGEAHATGADDAGSRLVALGVEDSVVADLTADQLSMLTTFSADRLERNVAYLRSEGARGKVKNPTAYLYAAVTGDYASKGKRQSELFGDAAASDNNAADAPEPLAPLSVVHQVERARLSEESDANAALDARIGALDPATLADLDEIALPAILASVYGDTKAVEEAVTAGLRTEQELAPLGVLRRAQVTNARRDVMATWVEDGRVD